MPLAFRLPGRILAGQLRNGFLGAIDLPATMLEAAGVTTPLHHLLPDSPGRSAWRYAATGAEPVRCRLYAETGGWRMVTGADWKYVRHADGRDALFDRHRDPHDLHDLSGNPPYRDILAAMRAALLDEMMACRAPNAPDYWPQRDRERNRCEVRPEHHPEVPAGTWWQTGPCDKRDSDAR